MTEKHLAQMQDLATKRGEVIIVRPVSEFAQQLIEEGHPTKSLHMKGKSSDWGPQAGFIPVDQSLSKITDPEKASYSSGVVAGMLEKHQGMKPGQDGSPSQLVEATPLVLTPERMETLEKGGHIKLLRPNQDGSVLIEAARKSGSEIPQTFVAIPQQEGGFAISTVSANGTREPVMVVGTRLPGDDRATALTADYDVLAVCPPLSDFGPQDRAAMPEIVPRKREDLEKRGLSEQSVTALSETPKTDPNLGNVSPRLEEFISDAVAGLTTGEGRQTVHHGPDTHNPVADLDGDFRNGSSMTVFLPTDLRYENPETEQTETLEAGSYSVSSKEDLVELMHTLRENGFQVPRDNPQWDIKKEDRSTLKRLPAFKEMEAKLGRNPTSKGVDGLEGEGQGENKSVRSALKSGGSSRLDSKEGIQTGTKETVRDLIARQESRKTPSEGPKRRL